MERKRKPPQPNARILLLLGNVLYGKPVIQAAGDLKTDLGESIEVRYHLISDEKATARINYGKVEKDIRRSNIILIDRSKDPTLVSLIEKHKKGKTSLGIGVSGDTMVKVTNLGSFASDSAAQQQQTPTGLKRISAIFSADSVASSSEGLKVKRSWLSLPARFLQFGKSKHIRNYAKIYRYWEFGDKENIKQLLRFLAREYCDLEIKAAEPKVLPPYAIYHPKTSRLFTDTDKYIAWYTKKKGFKDRPAIGILFYTKHYVTGNMGYLDELIEKLEEQANVLPVMSEGLNNMAAMKKYFMKGGNCRVDAIISFPLFRLAGGPSGGDYQASIRDLQQMNVPMLKPITMISAPIKDWAESASGISPIYTALGVSLPEMDGAIESIPVAGFEAGQGKDDAGGIVSIEGRLGKVARRAVAWARLKRKANGDKKVAFILYNYPPGKSTVGSAAYLDVFSSLINILGRMKEAGYDVGTYPRTARDFLRLITQRNLVNVDKSTWTNIERAGKNAFLVDANQYDEWFSELPRQVREEMESEWGEAPGDVMRAGNNLLVPGIKFGNIFIGFQPARGWGDDVSKMYHDRNLAPHHQYLAFYRWVERVFQADALVHFGTHGTLEFLPGKQIGLSENCYPDIVLPELPNAYIYIVTGSSEGTIARRRACATLINYNTPPMTVSGAYSTYAELEDNITAYYDIVANNPDRVGTARDQILAKAKEAKLIDEEQDDFSIDSLYHDIIEMKSSLIPRGVHVMGKKLKEDDEIDYLLAALRFERGDVYPLQKILCASRLVDWDKAKQEPSKRSDDGKAYGEILSEVDAETKTLIQEVIIKKKSPGAVLKKAGINLSKERQTQLKQTLDFGAKVVQNLRASVDLEIENTLKVLDAGYILPGVGGDPVRSPDILPTGRNMVAFDPRKVPTKLAEERASVITRQILDDYVKEHGEYPESVGAVLFSLEVMQTHGETVSEIFELIGVRPIRSGIGYIDPKRFEIIPLEELGRPRIDVAIDLSGIFRDTFPDTLEFIGIVIKAVADLDEPADKNFIRKHSLEIEKNLIAAGQSEEEAKRFSKMRTFGVGAGIYGTNISKMIANSEWTEEKDIAELYLDKQSHFYGDGVYGAKNPEALNEILKHVSVCAQVRSTSLYGISDLDHYYEHLGGLASSIGHVRKKKPSVMVADSASEKITTRKLGKQIEAEARTRFLDKKWIDGMLDSGSRGIGIIADRTEHMVGWAATTKDVDSRIFKEMAGKYVFDEETRKKIIQENPWTLNDIMRKLMEAAQRGYWQTTPEELDKMKQIYLELEEEIEEREV